MKKSIFFCMLLIANSGFAQFKEYDIVNSLKTNDTASRLIYMTATWCKPCMDKLPSIMSEFSNSNKTTLTVVFDKTGLSANNLKRLAELYDTSMFRIISSNYYPTRSNSGISIKVNPSNKVMKNIAIALNTEFKTNYSLDDFWFGKALIKKDISLYITKDMDKNKLLAEINSKL